ncbi:ABC-type amino acid transport system, substrate-binding protein/permease [Candidatus Phytoplasma solani]|uniref:ABC transporter substrate-binding protein/permease n=1 Tax=Candidatus Phytoplasma solani TaxID=69896 RepID=UPI0032DB2A8C
MKRSHLIIILIYLFVLVFSLWADADFKIPFTNNQTKQIDLIVGMELEYLPLGYLTNENNEDACYNIQGQSGYACGYDVLVAKKLAEGLNRKLIIKKISFDGLIPALKNNEIDLVISGLSQTQERQKEIVFSEPYCFYGLEIILNKSKSAIKDLGDLKKLKIGYQSGSSYASIVSQISDFSTSFQSYNDLETSFLATDMDGFIAESFLAQVFVNKFGSQTHTNKHVNEIFSKQQDQELLQSRIALKKENDTLLKDVNKALTKFDLKQQGKELMQIIIKQASVNNDYKINLWQILKKYKSLYFQGFIKTMQLAFLGTISAFFLTLLLFYLKGIPKNIKRISTLKKYLFKCLNAIVNIYIFIIKGVPMMVQAMIFYYGLKSTGYFKWLTPFCGGLIVITFNSTAYLAETMFKNIEFLDLGQIEAALALGMTPRKTLKTVVLPQVIQKSLLRFCNEFVNNIKDSYVFEVIGLFELFNSISQIRGATLNINVFLIPVFFYLFLNMITFYLFKKIFG